MSDKLTDRGTGFCLCLEICGDGGIGCEAHSIRGDNHRVIFMNKIRLIASREGLQIKEVVNTAFESAIKSYERKHGVIEDDGRGNVDNLF